MKKIIFLYFMALAAVGIVNAQTAKKHWKHTASATLKGAKYGGPVGAAGGFVIGRHFDKKKTRKEQHAIDTKKHNASKDSTH